MYKTACTLTALVCLVLFIIFVTIPGSYTAGYGVPADAGGAFLGRRASPMLLGLAILLWMLRDQSDVGVQRAVALAMAVSFAGIALTGVYAFMTGVASQTIVIAALGELVIAGAFLVIMRRA